MKIGLTTTGWVTLVLGVALLLLLAFCTGCVVLVPEPPKFVVVGTTGSMKPTFLGGEVRRVTPKPFDALQSGEIVLTYFDGRWNIHRLGYCRRGRWTTQGDNNNFADRQTMTAANYGGVVSP